MTCIVDINGENIEVYGDYEAIFDDKFDRFVVDKPISMNSKCRLDEDIQARFDDISKIMYNHLNLNEFPPCQEGWNETFEHLKGILGTILWVLRY